MRAQLVTALKAALAEEPGDADLAHMLVDAMALSRTDDLARLKQRLAEVHAAMSAAARAPRDAAGFIAEVARLESLIRELERT